MLVGIGAMDLYAPDRSTVRSTEIRKWGLGQDFDLIQAGEY